MPSEITASVGKPEPLPKRPTMYATVWYDKEVGWRFLGYGANKPITTETSELIITIPGDDAPPPARDEVREAAEAVLKQYDVAWSISWLDNLKVSIVALRTALATKGPAK